MSRGEVFLRFCWQAFRDNRVQDGWWLLGTMLRAAHAYILDQFLLLWLVDSVIAHADAELGLRLALYKVGALLVDHYTSYHYSCNFGMCARAGAHPKA